MQEGLSWLGASVVAMVAVGLLLERLRTPWVATLVALALLGSTSLWALQPRPSPRGQVTAAYAVAPLNIHLPATRPVLVRARLDPVSPTLPIANVELAPTRPAVVAAPK